jgi:hypothetical protein
VGLGYSLCRSDRQMEVSGRHCLSRNPPEAILEHCYMRLCYGGVRDTHLPCDVEPYCVLRGDRYAEGLSSQILKHDNSIACRSGRAAASLFTSGSCCWVIRMIKLMGDSFPSEYATIKSLCASLRTMTSVFRSDYESRPWHV